jgi:hypothetical protein
VLQWRAIDNPGEEQGSSQPLPVGSATLFGSHPVGGKVTDIAVRTRIFVPLYPI